MSSEKFIERYNIRKEIRECVRKILKTEPLCANISKLNLNELLFETIELGIKDGKTITIKIPVLSGGILQKLDLSKVDFTNVSWGFRRIDNIASYLGLDKINEEYNYIIEDLKEVEHCSDYSNTNACIDLSRSFEALHNNGKILVSNCNFKNTKVTLNPETTNGLTVTNANLSNTGLAIPNDKKVSCYNSNLEGLDLIKHNTSLTNYVFGGTNSFHNCVLKNTRLNISYDKNEYAKKLHEEGYPLTTSIKAVLIDKLSGCYLNGLLLDNLIMCEKYTPNNTQNQDNKTTYIDMVLSRRKKD